AKGGPGGDYALYQKGIISGIGGDQQQKVSILNQLSNRYPNSGYQEEANYQLGVTYMNEGNYTKAIPYFQKVARDQNNPNAHKALQKLALRYFDLNETDKAAENYKKLIRQYKNTDEAKNAMTSLQSIYVSQGNPQEYFTFLKSIGRSVNPSTEDSITYAAAESSFAASDYANAIKQFSSYL